MGGCLAAEVGADRGSNKRRVAPIYWGSLGSRNAGKRGLTLTAGLDWMAQVTRVDLGVRAIYGGDSRGRQLHHKPMIQRKASATTMPTRGAPGAERAVLAESQSTTTDMAATETAAMLRFLG
ncbi:hypothetical protein V6N13_136862 [Hibiscus sabdariffa]